MSRTFTDESLLTWEAYTSGGRFGLATEPSIVFHCLTEPHRRARYVTRSGDEADAEQTVAQMADEQLREMLLQSQEVH
jgi:hypothetical protein